MAEQQDTTRPATTTFNFDISSFFYVAVKSAVESNFPHIKSPKLVGYGPLPVSELVLYVFASPPGPGRALRNAITLMLFSMCGSESNGSLRWVIPALMERGVDVMSATQKVHSALWITCCVADLFPDLSQRRDDRSRGFAAAHGPAACRRQDR
jgi:hypothetical protein